MNIQMIALNRLVRSPANVRKTGADLGIDELAASIAAHGLLQNLQVRQAPKGKFEVVAGGRRLAALKLLAKQKHFAKDAGIACHVLDDEDAGEISLAENTVRLPMHPADQFEAFQALANSGKGVEEIAARFGATPAIVRQRLKLASVSRALIELYRADDMSLDQLMAFTVSDDHTAQEAAWHGQPDWRRSPSHIRRTLTATHVEADDRRVLLVGLDAYKASGGGILRDLFEPEHEGYLTDPVILDRLVAERLDAEAAALRAEGWRWVEIVPEIDYETLRLFGRVSPDYVPPTGAAAEKLDELNAEYEALIDEHGEEPEGEIAERLDALADEIDGLSAGTATWRAEDIAIAGAMIGIGVDGQVRFERGLLRPEDVKARRAARAAAAGASGSPRQADPAALLSASLIEDLTAERTAALRAMMQDDGGVALAAVAHALALPVFYPYTTEAKSCLDLRLVSRDLQRSAASVEDSGAAILLDARSTAWLMQLPDEACALFGWLLAAEREAVIRLIAFCAAQSLDAVRGKQDRAGCLRLGHADQLADALGLDMSLWWQPTNERYLGRVPKAQVLEAVAEAVSPSAAENLVKLKKADLVAHAEERLAGKGWLPPILRQPTLAPVTTPEAVADEAEPMPLAAE